MLRCEVLCAISPRLSITSDGSFETWSTSLTREHAPNRGIGCYARFDVPHDSKTSCHGNDTHRACSPASFHRFDQLLEYRLSASQLRDLAQTVACKDNHASTFGEDSSKTSLSHGGGKSHEAGGSEMEKAAPAASSGQVQGDGGDAASGRDEETSTIGVGDDLRGGGDGEAKEDRGIEDTDEANPFGKGGVVPVVSIASKTKGRFASQVGGVTTRARSPVRVVAPSSAQGSRGKRHCLSAMPSIVTMSCAAPSFALRRTGRGVGGFSWW